jgi:hypothetical protein
MILVIEIHICNFKKIYYTMNVDENKLRFWKSKYYVVFKSRMSHFCGMPVTYFNIRTINELMNNKKHP